MTHIDIKSLRKKYLKQKKSDEILKGCFHPDDFKKYLLLEEIIEDKGYGYLTVEITNGRWITVKTIKVDEIIAVRGSAFYIYNKEIVFEYHKEKNIRIGVDLNQKEYHFEYYNYPQEVSYEDLVEMTEQLVSKHYDDIYHLWMLQDDVDKFADKLDLNLKSRLNLHKVRLDFCQKQYVGNYGFENPRISQLLTELKEDPRYFIGYKSYDKYLAEENPITVGE